MKKVPTINVHEGKCLECRKKTFITASGYCLKCIVKRFAGKGKV